MNETDTLAQVTPVYTKLKDLHLRTELAKQGQANAAIVAPASGVYGALAGRIQETILRRSRVDIPIVKDDAPEASIPNGAGRNPFHTFGLLELRLAGRTVLEGFFNQVMTRSDGMVPPEVGMDAALRRRNVIGGSRGTGASPPAPRPWSRGGAWCASISSATIWTETGISRWSATSTGHGTV